MRDTAASLSARESSVADQKTEADKAQGERVVIKKYANRRLYNTSTSTYVTLDNLATMVRDGIDFVVFDAKSNDDITRSVLAQIIFEEESKGASLLPIQFLRQLIGFYGDSMQSILPSYLELSMDNFTRQQEQFRKQFSTTFGAAPGAAIFDEQVRQNLAMFERAMKMFSPFAYPAAGQASETPQAEPKAEPAAPANPLLEAQAAALEQMRRQMEEMQAQLARLSGGTPRP
jgi:polyhydroxyalkanoate synthesis repressor PhaR